MRQVASACVLAHGCWVLVRWKVVLEVSDGLQSDCSSLHALVELVELLKARLAWSFVLLLRPVDGLLSQLRSGLEPGVVCEVTGMALVWEDVGNEVRDEVNGEVALDAWRAVMASMVFMPMHSCSGSDGADADVQVLAGATHPPYIRHRAAACCSSA